jgi:hypothetical protein
VEHLRTGDDRKVPGDTDPRGQGGLSVGETNKTSTPSLAQKLCCFPRAGSHRRRANEVELVEGQSPLDEETSLKTRGGRDSLVNNPLTRRISWRKAELEGVAADSDFQERAPEQSVAVAGQIVVDGAECESIELLWPGLFSATSFQRGGVQSVDDPASLFASNADGEAGEEAKRKTADSNTFTQYHLGELLERRKQYTQAKASFQKCGAFLRCHRIHLIRVCDTSLKRVDKFTG